AVRHARDRLALDAAPVPDRRGERRRSAPPPLPLARPPARADAAQPSAGGDRNVGDPPSDGGARLPRRGDAEPHARHARGRARLPRARAVAAAQVLRAATVAPALQAAPDDLRLRPLLPDRALLPRRGPPRRPSVRVPPARRGALLRGPRGRARHPRAGRLRRVPGARPRAARASLPASNVARDDGP